MKIIKWNMTECEEKMDAKRLEGSDHLRRAAKGLKFEELDGK